MQTLKTHVYIFKESNNLLELVNSWWEGGGGYLERNTLFTPPIKERSTSAFLFNYVTNTFEIRYQLLYGFYQQIT